MCQFILNKAVCKIKKNKIKICQLFVFFLFILTWKNQRTNHTWTPLEQEDCRFDY